MRDIPVEYYLITIPVLAVFISVANVVKNVGYFSKKDRSFKAVVAAAGGKGAVFDPRVLVDRRMASDDFRIGKSASKCAAIEYRGPGLRAAAVTPREWKTVMDQFHDAKARLVKWLEANRARLPQKTYEVLVSETKEIRLQRPPAAAEPDLAWRGIVALSSDEKGPLIRAGGGFPKLVRRHPAWSRFELARAIAQRWAPCSLLSLGVESPWTPLLDCIGAPGREGCEAGSYSEAAWAVSTAVASIVSGPGCDVPAFAPPAIKACLKRVPMPSDPKQEFAMVSGAGAVSHE